MKSDFRKLIAVLLLSLLYIAGVTFYESKHTALPTPLSPTQSEILISGMQMTFYDEFTAFNRYVDANGNDICGEGGSGTWQTVYYNCTRTTASNNEAQNYTTDSITATSGVLMIAANPTAGQPLPYSSGLITTQHSFAQTYGYFEMRAQVPAGAGLWPAFWLLPSDTSWPPEIDAMEAFGDTNPVNGEGGHTLIHYASHTPPNNQICGTWYDTGVDVTAGFHTYGVDWEPTGITYYFDGNPYASCPPNTDANKPFYILINLAVGGVGSWPGTPTASTTWPAVMKVEYVRAYQKK